MYVIITNVPGRIDYIGLKSSRMEVAPLATLEQHPTLTRHSEDPILVTTVPKEMIRASKQQSRLPSRHETRIESSDLISFLALQPPGCGVLYPLYREQTLISQRKALLNSAATKGVPVKVHIYDELHFLVEKLGSEETSVVKPRPTLLTPIEVGRWKLAKSRGVVVFRPTDDKRDYRAYLNVLMLYVEDDGHVSRGVLVPITSKGTSYCQTRLHLEAKHRGIRVKTREWDPHNLLVEFNGYIAYKEPVHLKYLKDPTKPRGENIVITSKDLVPADHAPKNVGTIEDLLEEMS